MAQRDPCVVVKSEDVGAQSGSAVAKSAAHGTFSAEARALCAAGGAGRLSACPSELVEGAEHAAGVFLREVFGQHGALQQAGDQVGGAIQWQQQFAHFAFGQYHRQMA